MILAADIKGYVRHRQDISDYECAMLAGIPNLPSEYSPDVNKKLAEKRVSHVLKSMERRGMITQEEAEEIEDNNF